MILSAQSIRARCGAGGAMISPYCKRTEIEIDGKRYTYGISPAGYDVRLAQAAFVSDERFSLASTMEHFVMPRDVLAQVCDKSTWARQGLVVQNTIIEPGWRGFLTLELTFHGWGEIILKAGTPIAQVVFMQLDKPTDAPYDGKYQDQAAGPQGAR
jgi:dCTP deaminase